MAEVVDALLKMLAESGPGFVIAALAIWYAFKKDQLIQELYAIMQRKTEQHLERYHNLASEMTSTLNEVVKLLGLEED